MDKMKDVLDAVESLETENRNLTKERRLYLDESERAHQLSHELNDLRASQIRTLGALNAEQETTRALEKDLSALRDKLQFLEQEKDLQRCRNERSFANDMNQLETVEWLSDMGPGKVLVAETPPTSPPRSTQQQRSITPILGFAESYSRATSHFVPSSPVKSSSGSSIMMMSAISSNHSKDLDPDLISAIAKFLEAFNVQDLDSDTAKLLPLCAGRKPLENWTRIHASVVSADLRLHLFYSNRFQLMRLFYQTNESQAQESRNSSNRKNHFRRHAEAAFSKFFATVTVTADPTRTCGALLSMSCKARENAFVLSGWLKSAPGSSRGVENIGPL